MADVRSHSSIAYGSRTNTTIPAPGAIVDGDPLFVIFLIGRATEAPPITPPSGFTEILDAPYPISVNPGGFEVEIHLYRKQASGESGDYAFLHDQASTTAWMCAVADAAADPPVVTGATDVDTTPTAPGLTVPADNSLVIFWAQSFDFLGAVTPPATPPTWTERLDSAASILYVATGVAGAGPTGDKTVTVTQDPSSAGLILFSPAQTQPQAPARRRRRRGMIFDPVPLKLLDNQSALNTLSQEFGLNAFDAVELSVDFKAGVTAGAVVLEVAPFGGYTGAWDTVLTATFSGTAPQIQREETDIVARVGRLRISTALTGGVCDAYVSRSITAKAVA